RAPRPPDGRRGNPGLLVAVAASALLQVGGVLFGPLRSLLGTTAVGPRELLACAAVATLPGLVLRWTRRRPGRRSARDQRPGTRVQRP
ncbi:MAG: hypothetical protein WA890_11780, partial [Micromonospora sp.]